MTADNKLRLFKRVAKLTLTKTDVPADDEYFNPKATGGSNNSVVITDLRIQFDVERTLKKNPNTCTVKITNLNPDSRKVFSKKPLHVTLEAGYDGVTRLLYTGDMFYAVTSQKDTDIETMIQCGDGDRIFASARANKSYGKGTSVKKVLRDLAKSIGQQLPANIEASAELEAQFGAGTVTSGMLKNELTTLLAPYGYSWSLQNGKLQILRDADTSGTFTLNEANGVIGFPEFGSPPRNGKSPNLTLRCFLFPELYPGAAVNVDTKFLHGTFKIEKVNHKGDTHGDDWSTEVELKPSSAPGSGLGSKK